LTFRRMPALGPWQARRETLRDRYVFIPARESAPRPVIVVFRPGNRAVDGRRAGGNPLARSGHVLSETAGANLAGIRKGFCQRGLIIACIDGETESPASAGL
jgi:hypothetical protein